MPSSRSSLIFVLVVAVVAIPVNAAFADHRSGHGCGGSAGILGGVGQASTSCAGEAGPAGVVIADRCEEGSTVVASYGSPPASEVVLYEEHGRRMGLLPGFSLMAGFNCAGVYVSGPHVRRDPVADDTTAAFDRARARLKPALPEPSFSPAEAVVRIPTWLWLDADTWTTTSASATEGAVTVTVSAEPVGVVWDLSEGTRRCDGPGRPWSVEAQAAYERASAVKRDSGDPACTFTFVHSSTIYPERVHAASVTVTWEFSWTANGVPRGVFGTVERTTAFQVRVGEVQALITGY